MKQGRSGGELFVSWNKYSEEISKPDKRSLYREAKNPCLVHPDFSNKNPG
jgi:hypothetical protein